MVYGVIENLYTYILYIIRVKANSIYTLYTTMY